MADGVRRNDAWILLISIFIPKKGKKRRGSKEKKEKK